MRTGFMSREDARRPTVRKAKRQVSIDTLRVLGVEAVRDMNPRAAHPMMKPHGSTSPDVYVLGFAPDKDDDEIGRPFSGKAGTFLRAKMPRWLVRRARFGYICPTLPLDTPTWEQIECFRQHVEKDIAAVKPPVVILVGHQALRWATGESSIKTAAGRVFHGLIAGTPCRMIPIQTPGQIRAVQKKMDDGVPGYEWLHGWTRALDLAASAVDFEPFPTWTPEQALEVSKPTHCMTLKAVDAALDALWDCKRVGWDWETHQLRPYKKDAKILTVALSSPEGGTFAIPVDHPEAPWTDSESRKLKEMLREFFTEGPECCAFNLPFELEWLIWYLGTHVGVFPSTRFHDAAQAAFVLNPGPPGEGSAGLSLGFQCKVEFGVDIKALTYGGSRRGQLEQLQLAKVLDYNAVDAYWTEMLMRRLAPRIKEHDLEQSYNCQLARVGPIVMTQRLGIPVDESTTNAFQEQFASELVVLDRQIARDSDVVAFTKRYGSFNPDSGDDVGKLLSFLAVDTETTSKGKISTKAVVLEPLAEEYPALRMILERRSVNKLKGTYVDRFRPDHPETYVYPDGRIHCNFRIDVARTARLSSDDPNNQNWPNRKHKEVRRQLVPLPGHVFLSADQGQIEARGLAMDSKDPRWVSMLLDDYDVHMEWAEKLVRVYPKLRDQNGGSMKAVRSMVKNAWVFPAFYGSSVKSIARNIGLSVEVATELFEEFWDTFAEIKRWQDRKWKQYQRTFEVRSLTGRRRLGPLSRNMVINTPIQCTASDITQDAANRLAVRAVTEDKPWLQPALLVHDDIKLMVPKKNLDEAISIVVAEQLGFSAPWVNVPLSVEVEAGPYLTDMKSVGTWRSNHGVQR